MAVFVHADGNGHAGKTENHRIKYSLTARILKCRGCTYGRFCIEHQILP